MLKLNAEKWLEQGVCARVTNLVTVKPFYGKSGGISAEPLAACGLTLNVHLGDSIFGWGEGIIEPGIIAVAQREESETQASPINLSKVCCLGNKVKLLGEGAGGLEAIVIGASFALPGAILVDFPERLLQKVYTQGHFWILSRGKGLGLADFPSVRIFGIDPECINKFEFQLLGRNRLLLPVTCFIPADYFVPLTKDTPGLLPLCYFNTAEKKEIEKLGIGSLRFGDIIAISDLDLTEGFKVKKGAISIGLVTLAPIPQWDIGVGINVILSCGEGKIVPVINPNANFGRLLTIGRFRKSF